MNGECCIAQADLTVAAAAASSFVCERCTHVYVLLIVPCNDSPWQLFLDDPKEPGRYILMRQQGSKPTLDDIEVSLYLTRP